MSTKPFSFGVLTGVLAGGPSLVYAVYLFLKKLCSHVNETVSFGGPSGVPSGGASFVYAVCSFLKKL